MCLISVNANPSAWKVFQVELLSFENTTKTIKFRHEPLVTIKHIRQVCKFRNPPQNDNKEDDEDEKKIKKRKPLQNKEQGQIVIAPGEKVNVCLEFKNNPEYIEIGNHIIINDGLLKAFGTITKLIK
jgi:GTPase